MLANLYTNTGIQEASWNSRGLVLHNAVNKSLIRQDNGTLWAAVREGHVNQYINIYRSTDNGFSWNKMWSGTFAQTVFRTGISGLNTNGPCMHLTINEDLNRLILWHSFFHTSALYYNIQPFTFDITDDGLTRIATSGSNGQAVDYLDPVIGADDLWFDVSYTNDIIFLTYVSDGYIIARPFRHTLLSQSDGLVEGTVNTYFNVLSTFAKDNNTLMILILNEADSNTYELQYILFNRISGTFSDPVIITSSPVTRFTDLNIAQDGFGTICAYWTQLSEDDLIATEYYSLSFDNGETWTEPETFELSFGQYDFVDNATNQRAARTVLLHGLQGFMLGYTRGINEHAETYVRLLTSTNGQVDSYVLGEEKNAVSNGDKDIVGLRFFLPPSNSPVDLSNPGEVRVAFSQGRSTSTVQVDAEPSYFGQKLLSDQAFAAPEAEFEQDYPNENELLINFNLLGSTDENVDYYDEGLIGNLTSKYISAFNKFGTSCSLENYLPIQKSKLSDKSSYSEPENYYVKVFIDELTYSNPTPRGNETFRDYIERDTRTIYLPPQFHLGRTFIINDGNYLKRNVWILNYAGNQYEVTQVVPKFIDNQIVYYKANLYVVGPSNNPFTKIILPSET